VGEAGAISVLAEATANRLRLLQRELGDERSSDRSSALAQEVKDAIAKVVPEQRQEFLEELRSRFPTFDGGGMPASDSSPEDVDPLILFDRLASQAGKLSAAEKQAVVERLKEEGFPVGGAGAPSPDPDLMEVGRLLQIGPNAKPDAARAAQLLFVLIDFIQKLDQAAWGSWTQIAPESDIRKNASLAKLMGRFVKGELARQQVSQETDRLLRLTASIVVALQRIGPGLFNQYFRPVSPSEIKEEATRGGLLQSKEKQWWAKYEERAAAMDSDSFNAALFAAVARFVKDFFQPGGLPPATEPR